MVLFGRCMLEREFDRLVFLCVLCCLGCVERAAAPQCCLLVVLCVEPCMKNESVLEGVQRFHKIRDFDCGGSWFGGYTEQYRVEFPRAMPYAL